MTKTTRFGTHRVETPPPPISPIWGKLAKGVIAVALLAALWWLAEHLSTVIIMLAVASLLAFILDPLVTHLSEKMPRGLAIALTYVGLIGIIVVGGLMIVPTIIKQVHNLQENLPAFRDAIQNRIDSVMSSYEVLPDQVKDQLINMANAAQEAGNKMLHTFFEAALGFFAWMAKGMIILVLSIYLLLDKRVLRESSLALVPVAARAETISVVGDVLHVIRGYLRGQIVVIGFVAAAVTGMLLVAGMPYALTIGVMAGILEVIPYFGAVVGAVPAILWAFLVEGSNMPPSMFLHLPGNVWGCIFIGFFVLVNQCEGHIVIPFVMGRSLEMRPLVVLLSLLTGAELGGIVGLIVAVPVCRILQVFVEHGLAMYRETQEDRDSRDGADFEEGEDLTDAASDDAGSALGMAGFTGRLDEKDAPVVVEEVVVVVQEEVVVVEPAAPATATPTPADPAAPAHTPTLADLFATAPASAENAAVTDGPPPAVEKPNTNEPPQNTRGGETTPPQ